MSTMRSSGRSVLRTGRRTVRVGDMVAIDNPYLNAIARVVGGPDAQRGTRLLPKFEFEIERGVFADTQAGIVEPVPAGYLIWLEDDARVISIFGVDDHNITLT